MLSKSVQSAHSRLPKARGCPSLWLVLHGRRLGSRAAASVPSTSWLFPGPSATDRWTMSGLESMSPVLTMQSRYFSLKCVMLANTVHGQIASAPGEQGQPR